MRNPFRRDPANRPVPRARVMGVSVDPATWTGALVVMTALAAVLWIVQAINSVHRLTQYGLQPRHVSGLRGVITEPFLHGDWQHIASNTVPLIFIGWVVLLAGVRTWVLVTAVVVLGGGLATWVVAPGNQIIVGASGMIFGWLGYLLARAIFSREIRWIIVGAIVFVFFGSLLYGLSPSLREGISWQAHLCGLLAGVLAAALVHHPRGGPGPLARHVS